MTRFKHKAKGYRGLLTDPAVVADLHDRAQRIAAAASGAESGADGSFHIQEFDAPTPSTPRKRARAAVVAPMGDPDNRMIRNLDAGR